MSISAVSITKMFSIGWMHMKERRKMLTTEWVKPILETMYECRAECVPCFIGPPGIGKTQGIYEFAKEKGVNVVTFILSNTVPSEVSGIRMPDKETKKMEVFDDLRMASLKDGDILFLDEILEAPPMLWSACLTLIQDRIMASGRKLPDVFIVAASNQVASPGIIPASVRNRFMFFEVRFDPEAWQAWFKDKYGVDVDDSLCGRIQENSTTYNVLTPRTVAKLYEYMLTAKNNGHLREAKYIVEDMFDAYVVNQLCLMVNYKKKPKEQLRDVLINIDPSIVPEDFMNMSFAEILETLSALPEWDNIKLVLETTPFDELER